jgi:hypothetical protein
MVHRSPFFTQAVAVTRSLVVAAGNDQVTGAGLATVDQLNLPARRTAGEAVVACGLVKERQEWWIAYAVQTAGTVDQSC